MSGSVCKNLEMFGRLCGDRAAERVRLVTTMWDKVNDTNTAENRVAQLEGNFWKPLIDAGARHRRFENTSESAWNIIRDATGDFSPLLIQEELVDVERRLNETAAGKALYSQFQRLLQEQKDAIKQLSYEAKTQQDPAFAKELEAEYKRIEAQLQKSWEETEKLEIPLLRRLALSKKETRHVSILYWMYLMRTHIGSLTQRTNMLESIEALRKLYRKYKAVAALEIMITFMLECQPQGHTERSLFMSAENEVAEVIDKPRTEVDLDSAIRLGQGLVAVRIPGHPHRSESLKKLIELLMQRFQKQDTISDLDDLVMLHRDILGLYPPGDKARPSLLHGAAHCLWSRFQRQGRTCDLEEAIAFEWAALRLYQHGHADHVKSFHNVVRCHGELRKAGKVTDVGELIALGRTVLELGPSDHADYASSLRELALRVSEGFNEQAVAVDIQEAIALTDSALTYCPRDHVDRPVLLKAVATYRRKNLKSHAKTDRDGVKRLIGVAVYNTLGTLPTRLLDTLTGRLCGRDELMSDFDNSAQYKELLESATNYHPPQHEYIRETVSSYFQYATLSHRWGSDEPVLRDVQGRVIYKMELPHGIIKLQTFCAEASERGYRWAWSDTCCIDKESSAELQEAIGSMFRWYRRSSLTIVHLADVSDDGALSSSVWFERGWTLQELLAPRAMLFFTQDWSPYRECSSSNHKEDSIVLAELEKVTNIARHHLTDFHPGTDDARSRLQWASTRHTTRPEDMAYSLFGVFNLHLPVLYGEPKENALGRLLAEIISQSGDLSVLDWVGEASPYHSCFPAHIAVYRTLPFLSSHVDQIQSSMLNVHELVSSSQSLDALFASLSKFDPPHFIGRRLKLPCIVHRVTAIHPRQWESSTPSHAYDIQAEGLMTLQIVLLDEFKNDSLTTFPYVLVRPWHPNLLHSSTVADATATEQLAMTLGQPFHALLLEELPQNEYRRVASSSVIIARAASAASILCSNVQTLSIV